MSKPEATKPETTPVVTVIEADVVIPAAEQAKVETFDASSLITEAVPISTSIIKMKPELTYFVRQEADEEGGGTSMEEHPAVLMQIRTPITEITSTEMDNLAKRVMVSRLEYWGCICKEDDDGHMLTDEGGHPVLESKDIVFLKAANPCVQRLQSHSGKPSLGLIETLGTPKTQVTQVTGKNAGQQRWVAKPAERQLTRRSVIILVNMLNQKAGNIEDWMKNIRTEVDQGNRNTGAKVTQETIAAAVANIEAEFEV